MLDLNLLIDTTIAQAAAESRIPASVLMARNNGHILPALNGHLEHPYNARWLEEEDRFLLENIGSKTDQEIGQALGRTAQAIKIHRQRRGYPAHSKRPGWLTGHQTAKALGTDVHAICLLYQRGLFPCEQLPGPRGILNIRRMTLYIWATNPENWVYFKLEKVRDPHLRRLISLKRQRWGDEWWTTGQVADYHGVDHRIVDHFILKGKLPAKRWGNWWVKRSQALRPGLFFPTGKGSSQVVNHAWNDEAEAFLLLAHALGLTFEAIAAMMKMQQDRLEYHYKYLLRTGRILDLIGKYGLKIEYNPETGRISAEPELHRWRFPGASCEGSRGVISTRNTADL